MSPLLRGMRNGCALELGVALVLAVLLSLAMGWRP